MSDNPGDDTRATDPWGNPLPSGGQVPQPPPAPTPPPPPPGPASPGSTPPGQGAPGSAPDPTGPPPVAPDAWWPGAPDQPDPWVQPNQPPGPPDAWGQPPNTQADPRYPQADPTHPQGWSQPQPGTYPGAYPVYAPYPQAKNLGTAIAALVCGILSVVCSGWCGIVIGPAAIVLGIVSRNKISASNGTLKGQGMATAGIVLGIIGTIISVAALIVLAANPDIVNDLLDRLTTTTTTPG